MRSEVGAVPSLVVATLIVALASVGFRKATGGSWRASVVRSKVKSMRRWA
jgi:hypothetical protein